ncbi:MAG: hypothetical protein WCW14_03865 [Candidatus Paceibacterota bacterium]|jgi:hypothetical protein
MKFCYPNVKDERHFEATRYVEKVFIVEAEDYSDAEKKARMKLEESLTEEEKKNWEQWVKDEGTLFGLQGTIRACAAPREGDQLITEGRLRYPVDFIDGIGRLR